MINDTQPETILSNDIKVYDLCHLREMFDKDEALIKNLVKIFVDTVPVTCSEMLRHLEEKNWEDVGKLAHKMKPSLDAMHMNNIRQDVRMIELNAKQMKDLEVVPDACRKVANEVNLAVQQLKKEFSL